MAASTFFCLLLAACSASETLARSKYRNAPPRTVYDQKQSGDYNVQLHLKDFQIIAVLADSDLGLGDYDYSYDYDDFTIKPGSSSSTTSSSTTTVPPSTPFPSLISQKPAPSTEIPVLNVQPNDTPSSTHKPILELPQMTSDENATLNKLQENLTGVLLSVLSSKKPTEENQKPINEPGKIKVQILEGPVNPKPTVSGEETAPHLEGEVTPQGEVVHQKRCLTGFTRDKKGRCRRVRRPAGQLPFGFGRIASNLVSRFRNAESLPSSSSPESVEN